uniref:Uncharacterized protein n=1 Tax=Ananas comosus var. bracteatus TaxID=296719 RepID=A0A6V7QH91_ANACO|nr:unnamed protein product [Ananas comosus var. bracteatus]
MSPYQHVHYHDPDEGIYHEPSATENTPIETPRVEFLAFRHSGADFETVSSTDFSVTFGLLWLPCGLGLGCEVASEQRPACAVPNGPVIVNIPTLGMSLPYGIPFRRPIPYGRAYVVMAISGVSACGERPSQACANEHNGKQA